jgi:hypothetical protein
VIDCITITNNRFKSVLQTIESVSAQDLHERRHIVVVDRCHKMLQLLREQQVENPHLDVLFSGERHHDRDLDHLVYLRRMALGYSSGDMVAYIDDDDTWDPNHLSTLVHHIRNADVALSSVRLVRENGEPALLDKLCPWASSSEEAKEQFNRLVEIGVYETGKNVSHPILQRSPDGNLLICGFTSASMFVGKTARSFSLNFTHDLKYRKGEIHDAIYRIVNAGLNHNCLPQTTVTYRLGGFSNGRLMF